MPTRTITPAGVRVDRHTDWFIYDAPCANNPAHGSTRFARPREVAKSLFEKRQMIFSCIYCHQLRMPNEREEAQLNRLFTSANRSGCDHRPPIEPVPPMAERRELAG